MADDRTRGYNDGHRRPRPQAGHGADDPLAELARLIGQQNESAVAYQPNSAGAPYPGGSDADGGWATPDPYGQRGGMQDPGASQWAPDSPAVTPAAYDNGHAGYGNGQYDPGQYDPRQHDPRYADPRYAGSQYPDPQYVEPHYVEPQYADQRYPDSRQGGQSQDRQNSANQLYTDQAYADPRYSDPRYSDPRYAADPRYSDQHYSDQQYADPRYGDAAPAGYADPRYGDAAGNGYADPRYADPNLGGAPSQYGTPSYAPPPGSDQGYAGYGYQDRGQSYGNSYYGAPPLPAMAPAGDQRQPAQRRSIVTVLAVLALAVVGTASAFGYRAMFGGGGTAVPPPVITADTRPSKVVPATDPNAKPIQDRIGVKTEKVVPRQEEPVQQAAPGQPRQIAPWLPAQNPQNFPPANANVSPPTGSTGVGQPAAAPKRIKTVPIKPEQGADAGRNARTAAAPAAQPDDPIAAQISGAPLALSPVGSVPANRQGAPTVTASLPQGTGASPFPTPIAGSGSRAPVASANPASGPYAVQVTSQRSESDAQASYRSLQQQFPSVLGSRQPVIRRADLGEKGTYYRAQIPFQSQNEASEFCSNLKAAGGQCVIARN